MKNYAKLIFVLLFLFISLPIMAEEKINNFEVHFNLNTDASASVKEYIIVNAEGKEVKHGLFRKIPKNVGKNIKIESLFLDGIEHPYTVQESDEGVNIIFGTEDILPPGEYIYTLTYTLEHTAGRNFFNDFLFWPVTGGAWSLPIQKAAFILTIPYAAKPLPEKAESYIDTKQLNTIRREAENIFIFNAENIKKGQAFNIYFPMEKGLFNLKWYEIKYMPVFICMLIIIYYFIIWFLVGRDPKRFNLPYLSKPPKGVSAGFASYFLNGPFSAKNLATVLTSLMVKKKIEITFPKLKSTECKKIDDGYSDLEEDEARLFMSLPAEFKFDEDGYKYLQKGLTAMNYYYDEKKNNYIINNFAYMVFPLIFFIGILYYFHNQGVLPEVLFGGLVNFIIPLLIGIYTKNIRRIIVIVGAFLLFTMLGVSTFISPKILLNPNVIAIIITAFISALFVHLVNNLMYEGAVLRDDLAAFKKYMLIAEKDRVALSNPSVAGKIFCDYLPYAYAFGMESDWFDKFKNKIDFRIREMYDPLASSDILNVGLMMTISACFLRGNTNKAALFGGIAGGLVGKGRFGGGGR